MKRYTLYILTLLCLTGCSDWFDIKPETELVKQDFWKTKSDVESAVSACYRAMEEPDVMERLITWGEVRSDNVLRGYNIDLNLNYILSCNLDATNKFTSWGSIYSVINYCNTVIENAPGVREKDPELKEGELRAFMAEAMTVRALCYFYLVRTFKDVPFVTTPYSDDTRSFQIAQTDGDVIIDSLLVGLEAISTNHAKSVYTTTSDTKGRVTQKTLWTLMADMYLWRNKYDKCIELCDRVLQTSTNPLQLENSSSYNRTVFGTGNSTESIFELQFDTDNPDYVVNEMYGTQGGRSSVNHLSAAEFSKSENSLFNDNSDLRNKDSYFGNSSSAMVAIKKYISYRKESSSSNVSENDYVTNQNTQHWIFYRLSDIYLMRAEALVERNSGDDLAEALAMISKSYDRAHPSKAAGSLDKNKYNTQEAMRELVFNERQMEFMFEGKRYFDLLRRVRREKNLETIVAKYLLPKYVSQDQSTVRTKLNAVNALYMPINKDELQVNKLLKQNPFYATSSDIEKN